MNSHIIVKFTPDGKHLYLRKNTKSNVEQWLTKFQKATRFDFADAYEYIQDYTRQSDYDHKSLRVAYIDITGEIYSEGKIIS